MKTKKKQTSRQTGRPGMITCFQQDIFIDKLVIKLQSELYWLSHIELIPTLPAGKNKVNKLLINSDG